MIFKIDLQSKRINGWLAVLFAHVLACLSQNIGPFYADNGFNQSMAYRLVAGHNQFEMQQEILNILGLDTRPKPKRNGTIGAKYLANLYKSLLDEESGGLRVDNSTGPVIVDGEVLSAQSLTAISKADVIMSFTNQLKREESTNLDKKFWFDISQVDQKQNVIQAELRIFRNLNLAKQSSNKSFTIKIYQVAVQDLQSKHMHLTEIGRKRILMGNYNWIVFNLTNHFNKWISDSQTNQGLFLRTFDDTGVQIDPKSQGLKCDQGESEPFVLAFLQFHKESKSRTKRSAHDNLSQTQTDQEWNPYAGVQDRYMPSRSCQINSLYVSFKDLGWQDWIIAPDGYSAFFCHGECSFPLKNNMNATNHAIVQTLVHLMHPEVVPKPCCAPTKMSGITVLYFDDESNVILKKYKNMVVKACGCH